MAELYSIESITNDPSKAAWLERIIGNNAASYKHYWLRGIVDEVCAGNSEITFVRLVAKMAEAAWYPVVFFHLSLGVNDRLADLIAYLREEYDISQSPKDGEVVRTVEENYLNDAKLAKLIKDRTHNVPYRLIRPFYDSEIALAKNSASKWYDPMVDDVIFNANLADAKNSLYCFTAERDRVIVHSEWAQFIRRNEPVLRGWLDFKLVEYLQARNPSVPAISGKLRAPVKRDLAAATKYWKDAFDLVQIKDIYSSLTFSESNLSTYGSLTIDHFIPWSFVLHDEAWNLTPMFRSENSSKGDRLPDLAKYIDLFCAQQFDAMISIKEAGHARKHRKQFESYLLIAPELNQYSRSDRSRESFEKAVKDAVIPLYQIALNQGFSVWEGRQPCVEYSHITC